MNKNTFINLANKNSILTFKNITFINFNKTSNGAAITVSNGCIDIDNCVFKDYTTGSYNGVIHATGTTTSLTVRNSNFTGVGSAIYAMTISRLYLENNTFADITKASGDGLAIYTTCTNTVIKANKFINLKASKSACKDASIYMYSNARCNVTDNVFINCSSPSSNYAIVHMNYGVWLNNTFINSSNADGKHVFFNKPAEGIIYTTGLSQLNISNEEVNPFFKINVFALDDLNNIGLLTGSITANLVGNINYTLSTTQITAGQSSLTFKQIPEDGDYILNITSATYNTSIIVPTKIQINRNLFDIWVSPEGNNSNN